MTDGMCIQTKLILSVDPTSIPVQQAGQLPQHYALKGALTILRQHFPEHGLNGRKIKLELLKDGLWRVDSDHTDQGIAETQGCSDFPHWELGEYAFFRNPTKYNETLWYRTVYEGDFDQGVAYMPAALTDTRIKIGTGTPLVYTKLVVTDKTSTNNPSLGGKVIAVKGTLYCTDGNGKNPLPNQYLHAFVINATKTDKVVTYGTNGEVQTDSDGNFVMTIPVERLFGPDYGGSYHVSVYYMGSSGYWDGTSTGAFNEYMNSNSYFDIAL